MKQPLDAQHSVVGRAKGEMHMATVLENKLKLLVTTREHMTVFQNKLTGTGAASIPYV